MWHRNFCTEALLQKFLYPIVQKISVKSRWNKLFTRKTLNKSYKSSLFSGDRSPWVSCREAAVDLSNLEGSLWLFCSSSVAFFLVPVLILTCIYLRIFAAASKNSRGIRRNSFHQVRTLLLYFVLTCSWHQKTKPRILQFTNSRI